MALLSVKNKYKSLGMHVVQSPDILSDDIIETLPLPVKNLIKKPAIPLETQISKLKSQLTSTDYQIIKCYEYSLAGLALPYDITALHEEREALRVQIRELEEE